MKEIGSGTYGKVYETDDPNIVEKRIKMDEYTTCGISTSTIKEISALRAMENSKFIVPLTSFECKDDTMSLFFKRYKCDLSQFKNIKKNSSLILYQILLGLKEASIFKILHRDLKCKNIFLNSQNDVVIGDWGLATVVYPKLSTNVQTLHYRAPEILLNSETYGHEVDIWSLGCMLYELENNFEILFPGKKEEDQLELISKLLGTLECLYDSKNPIYKRHDYNLNVMKSKKFQSDEPIWDLFIHMIELDPKKRFTIDECLQHNCFDDIRDFYTPISPTNLLTFTKKSDIFKNHDINVKMRLILLDWLYDLNHKMKCELSCLFHTMDLMDLYLETTPVILTRLSLQLVGIVCFMIVTKLHDYPIYDIRDCEYICDHIYTIDELLKMEWDIVKTLNGRLIRFSSFDYLQQHIKPEFFKKSICLLFLLLSQAQELHPQELIDYYECEGKNDIIQELMEKEHANTVITKLNHITNKTSKYYLKENRWSTSLVPEILVKC